MNEEFKKRFEEKYLVYECMNKLWGYFPMKNSSVRKLQIYFSDKPYKNQVYEIISWSNYYEPDSAKIDFSNEEEFSIIKYGECQYTILPKEEKVMKPTHFMDYEEAATHFDAGKAIERASWHDKIYLTKRGDDIFIAKTGMFYPYYLSPEDLIARDWGIKEDK